MASKGSTSGGGFTAAYQDAASGNSAKVEDEASGLRVDHIRIHDEEDPSRPFRDRVANRVLSALRGCSSPSAAGDASTAATTSSARVPSYADIGCAVGNDMLALSGFLEGSRGDGFSVEMHGVDILQAQLDVARTRLPEATFHRADAGSSLPFEDGRLDVVHCSRLLIHVPDLERAVDELVRVLKPGGTGFVCEGDLRTSAVLSDDDRIVKVLEAQNRHVAAMCAHPSAATEAFRYLLSLPDVVENVKIRGYSMLTSDHGTMRLQRAGMDMFLPKLVETGKLPQEDVDYLFANIDGAVSSGNLILADTLFEVTFTKKRP